MKFVNLFPDLTVHQRFQSNKQSNEIKELTKKQHNENKKKKNIKTKFG